MAAVDVDAGAAYLYCYDANGNVGQVVGAGDGSLAARYEYDGFGQTVLAEGDFASQNPYRFSTKVYDEEVGLYYYGYRYYSKELGRWINRDPIEEDGGINLFVFLNNEPVNETDILGNLISDFRDKLNKLQVPKAIGLNAGGLIASKIRTKYGIMAGAETAVIFFADTCEISTYSVTAGIGDNLREWRPLSFEDFGDYEEGALIATLGVGIEYARYEGNSTQGDADSDSFDGIFHTWQGSLVIGASYYEGNYDKNSGRWKGGTGGIGPGFGGAHIDWYYEKIESLTWKLDNDPFGYCFCLQLISLMP